MPVVIARCQIKKELPGTESTSMIEPGILITSFIYQPVTSFGLLTAVGRIKPTIR